MPALDGTDGRTRGGYWLGMIRTLLVQVMVLTAIATAAVYYVDWSSEATLAEFSDAFKASVSAHWRGSSAPIRPVEQRTNCVPKT
jgi:hypothetical protein